MFERICHFKYNLRPIDIIYFKNINMSEDNKFDGILMTMIQQKGTIEGFFDGMFGFLRRNTDFFANQKKA